MDVIQRMGLVAADEQDKPKSPLTILKAIPLKGPPENQTSSQIVVPQ